MNLLHSIQMPVGLTPTLFYGLLAMSGLLLVGSLAMSGKSRRPRLRQFEPAVDVYESACRVFDGVSVNEAQAISRSFGQERRTAVRRGGNPVPVRVNTTGETVTDIEKTPEGVVLDRSTDGVRIVLDRRLSPGQVIQVRAEHAPMTAPWVSVEVRCCVERKKGIYEIGCQFTERLPWGVLLLFG